jgi:hypothetical protein
MTSRERINDTMVRDIPSRVRLSIFPDCELVFNDACPTTSIVRSRFSGYYARVYQHTSVPNSRNPFERRSWDDK